MKQLFKIPELQLAYDKGAASAQAQSGIEHNPYAKNTLRSDVWAMGYSSVVTAKAADFQWAISR